MKIAVFHDLPAGGAKRALHELCRELARRGHRLDLFVPETADETFLPLGAAVRSTTVWRVPGARRAAPDRPAAWTVAAWALAGRAQRALAAVIDGGGYDVAFVHGSRYPQAPALLRHLTVPALFYCQEPNRLLFDAPVADADDLGSAAGGVRARVRGRPALRALALPIIHRRRAERANAARATTVVANSYFSREAILRAYGVNATVAHLGVDPQRFRPLEASRDPVLLSVGVLHPMKGFGFLVRSLALVDPAVRPRLLIVGARAKPGTADALHRLAARAGVTLAIREAVSDAELVRYYNGAMAVGYAPYLEPFGFVPLEAMACGTAVVAVREGGVRECVTDGVTGLLVDRDPAAWAEAVTRVMTDRRLRVRLGQEGRRDVETRWTWTRTVDALEPVLERTARAAPSAPEARPA
jgi:glycosyltransferase involved in cell wall biosynthesis